MDILKENSVTEEQAKIIALRAESAYYCRESMRKEIADLQALLPILQDENALPDELIIPMHNIISIAPEEQYRFLADIKTLFARLPASVKNQADVIYVLNRLGNLNTKNTSEKVQETDLSMYWAAYRKFLYKYGEIDNSRQLKAQGRLQKKLLEVANFVIAKREQGVITAGKFIRSDRV